MSLTTKLVVVLVLLIAYTTTAQEVQSTSFTKTGSNGYAAIYSIDESNSYSVTRKLYGGIDVAHYTNSVKDSEVPCDLKINKQNAYIIQTLVLNGKLTMFLYVAKDKNRKLFIRTYNEANIPTDSEAPLMEYEGEVDASSLHTFNVQQSENGEFIAVESVGVDHTGKEVIGVNVFDKNLKLISKSVNSTPYIKNQSEIIARHLSNSGEYYHAANVYDVTGKEKDLERKSLTGTFISKYSSEDNMILSLNELNIDLNGKLIADMDLNKNLKDGLICSGVYGSGNEAGLFYFKLDFDSKKLQKESYLPLPKGTFEEDWVNMDIHTVQHYTRLKKWFETIDVFETEGGGLCFVLEQEKTSLSGGGGSAVEQNYYFLDVLIYSLNKDGEFEWFKILDKYQHVVNEREPLGGVFGYNHNGEYVLFFNDNIKQYGSNNEYSKIENFSMSVWGDTENCISKTTCDLKTGDMKRNRLVINGDPKQDKIFCQPDSFRVNYEKRELSMYFLLKATESFAVLKF